MSEVIHQAITREWRGNPLPEGRGGVTRALLIALTLGLPTMIGPLSPSADAACGKACQLIQKGYARDLKRCRAKWLGILNLCKGHPNPTPENNCGVPLPPTTTTSTTTTTTVTICLPTTTTTSTTTTTTLECFAHSQVWDKCGPQLGACTCHHTTDGTQFQFTCVDAGPQFQPVYEPCPSGCSSTQDCKDCLNDDQANVVCIKGAGEPPRGACVAVCQ